MFPKILKIFFLALSLNWIWENFHSLLYVHYQGREITSLILLRASLFDAVFIAILGILFLQISFLRQRLWLAFIFGFIFAVLLEFYALKTGRWAYNDLMPIIPILNVGLTPSIQLGLLSYLVFVATNLRKVGPYGKTKGQALRESREVNND